jgi:hypothetical protein
MSTGGEAINTSIVWSIGIFVPYGFFNAWGALSGAATGEYIVLAPVVFLLACFYFVDKVANWAHLDSWYERLFFYLAILFLITMCADLSLWHTWASLNSLLGKNPVYIPPLDL